MKRRKFVWFCASAVFTSIFRPQYLFDRNFGMALGAADPSNECLARLQSQGETAERSAGALLEAISAYERNLRREGFVNIRDIDPSLLVELKYASADNFMGENVYRNLRNCYLRPEAARKLKAAHDLLKERRPDLRLLVVDGFRPRSVQRRMWKLVQGTPQERYVANPATGSMHNYGVAVDLTLCTLAGARLDMGTSVDHFGILAQPRMERAFLKDGKLTRLQVENRTLLRTAMTSAGFTQLPIEWWHFDAMDRPSARSRYTMID